MLRNKPPPQDDEPVSGFMPGMSETKRKKGILKLFSRRKSSSFKINEATYNEPVKKQKGEKTLTEQRLAAIEMQLSEPPGSSQSAPSNTQAPATNQRPVSQGPTVNKRASQGPPKERPVSSGSSGNQRLKGKAPSPVAPVTPTTPASPTSPAIQGVPGPHPSQGQQPVPSPEAPVQTSTPVPAKTVNNNHTLPQIKVPQRAPRKKRQAPPPPPITASVNNNTVAVTSPSPAEVEPKTTHIEVSAVTIEPHKNGHKNGHVEGNETSVEQVTVVKTKTTQRTESTSEVPSVVNKEPEAEVKTATNGKSDTLKRKRRAPAPPPGAPAGGSPTSPESPSGGSPTSPQNKTSAPPPPLNLSISSSSSDAHESDAQTPSFSDKSESPGYAEPDALSNERPLPHFVAPPPPLSPPPPLVPATRDIEDLSVTLRQEKVLPEQTGPSVTTIIITESSGKEAPPSPEIRTNAVTDFKGSDGEATKGKSTKSKMDGRDSDSESSSDTSSVMAYDVNVSMDEPPVPGIDDGIILTGKRVFEEVKVEVPEMSSPTFDDQDPPEQDLPSPIPPLSTHPGGGESSEIIFDNLDVIYVSPGERTQRTNTDESSTDPRDSPNSFDDRYQDEVFVKSETPVSHAKHDDSAYSSFTAGNTTIYPGKEVQPKPKDKQPMVTNLRQLYRSKPPARSSEPITPSPVPYSPEYDYTYNSNKDHMNPEDNLSYSHEGNLSFSPEVPSMSSESSVSPDPVKEESYESTSYTQTWQLNENDPRDSEMITSSYQSQNVSEFTHSPPPPPPPPPIREGDAGVNEADIAVNNMWELIEEKKLSPMDNQRSDTRDTYSNNQGDIYNMNVGLSSDQSPRVNTDYETKGYTETRSVTSPSWSQPSENTSLQDQRIREETRRWSALVGPQGYMKQHQAFSFAHPETENESLLEEKSVSLLRSPGQDSHDEILKERYDDLQKKFYSWEQQLKENQALITKKVMVKTEVDRPRSNRDFEIPPAPLMSSPAPVPPAPPPVVPVTKAPVSRNARLHSAPEPKRQDSSGGLAGRFSPAELAQAKANLRNSQSEFDPSVRNATPVIAENKMTSTPSYSDHSSLKKKPSANGSAFRGTPRSQSTSSSRFEIKMDPREELMIAIRSAGGRGALKRVTRR